MTNANNDLRKKASRAIRKNSGSALIEVGCMGFVMPVMAVIAANIGVLVFAAWVNDAACRDAARAAAQQGNQSDAIVAAVGVTKQYGTGGGIFGQPKVLTESTAFQFEPYFDQEGVPQLEKGPFVTVTTRLNTVLPAPIIYGNTGFTNMIVFKQSYTFPILNPDQKSKSDAKYDMALAKQEEDELQKKADQAAALAAAQAAAAASSATAETASAGGEAGTGPT